MVVQAYRLALCPLAGGVGPWALSDQPLLRGAKSRSKGMSNCLLPSPFSCTGLSLPISKIVLGIFQSKRPKYVSVGNGCLYLLAFLLRGQAPTPEIKAAWVNEIRKVLTSQLQACRGKDVFGYLFLLSFALGTFLKFKAISQFLAIQDQT